MVQVLCERTGLIFEATSRRTKNHPEIMAWLQQAYKDGWYNQALSVIKEGREQGFSTIEQFTAAFQQAEKQAQTARHAAIREKVRQDQEAKDARREKAATNAFLREHGYRWQRREHDEEDIDFFGLPEYEWVLRAPDNRRVSVKEAMLELAYYEQNTWAKGWLEKRGIALEAPAIERVRDEERQARAQIMAGPFTASQQAYQQEALPVLLAAGLSEEQARYEAARLSLPHPPQEDVVPPRALPLPDGRSAQIVINGDFRYGVLVYGQWYGIEEILKAYPALPLQDYAAQNSRRAGGRS